jgi:hypothetical protein
VQRELIIALRARITWLVAGVSALLVGHGFVLAVDLYSASSRSALASALQVREMDPLAGIVRPTLGGLNLSICLFAPLIAARVLSVDKERRSFGPLCLLEGGAERVILKKLVAALCATSLLLATPLVLFVVYRASGGHLDAIETAVALIGEGLHLLFVTAITMAAASWTRTFAQAALLGVAASLTSWAIDAADGFAALAWLGGMASWSIEKQLSPFQRGIVSPGAIAWLAGASAGAATLALTGSSFELPVRWRRAATAATVVVTVLFAGAAASSRRGYDWSEQRRASLPPAAVRGLRALPQPLAVDVLLDRDDSRRRQLESDVLAKLYLARPDLIVHMPLDDRGAVALANRDLDYGRISIHVGSSSRQTRSTSRRELVTLVFEAAGLPLPDWTMPVYPGFPRVTEGRARTTLVTLAYLVLPVGFLIAGTLRGRKRLSR